MKGHPRAGKKTKFDQLFLSGIKKHTIRAGHRWKAGDMFSPRQWSGKPYRSRQIKLFSDMEVKKVYDVRIVPKPKKERVDGMLFVPLVYIKRRYGASMLSDTTWELVPSNTTELIAKNDGLSIKDFIHWFDKDFEGQIISWSNDVEY